MSCCVCIVILIQLESSRHLVHSLCVSFFVGSVKLAKNKHENPQKLSKLFPLMSAVSCQLTWNTMSTRIKKVSKKFVCPDVRHKHTTIEKNYHEDQTDCTHLYNFDLNIPNRNKNRATDKHKNLSWQIWCKRHQMHTHTQQRRKKMGLIKGNILFYFLFISSYLKFEIKVYFELCLAAGSLGLLGV